MLPSALASGSAHMMSRAARTFVRAKCPCPRYASILPRDSHTWPALTVRCSAPPARCHGTHIATRYRSRVPLSSPLSARHPTTATPLSRYHSLPAVLAESRIIYFAYARCVFFRLSTSLQNFAPKHHSTFARPLFRNWPLETA